MKATWILANGQQISAEVKAGKNLMEAAVAMNIPLVIGECGGSMSCATCHVVVGDAWVALLEPRGAEENSLLDSTAAPRQPHSRLSCQIVAGPALDGLVLHVPAG